MAGKRSQRGLTLVEILVVAAISSILFLAAAALLATLSAQRTNSRKRIDRLSEGFTALTILERTVLNAGYHFPSPRFGFRVFNNVQAGASYGGIPVEAPCTDKVCIIPNTDVLEIVEGHPGTFGMVSGAANDGGTLDVFLQLSGPIPIGDTGQYYFLFLNDDGRACQGFGSTAGAPTSMNVQMVDRDLNDVLPTYYGAGGPRNYPCPAPGMMVAAQQDRRHYFVGMPNQDAGEVIPSLYLQSAGAGNFDGGGVQLLVYGVDNLQITPLIRNNDAGHLTTGCANGLCRCNVSGADCILDGGNDDNEFMYGEFVQGVDVSISIQGDTVQRAYVSGQSGMQANSARARLADETWSTQDNIVRSTQRQTFMLRNFSQVQP